jgi:predicted Zn finger-like uncharacterized protein
LLFIHVNPHRKAQTRMILTCPACDTKYVVKDGAIPPGGRQVRCASCRHSWHQDPDEDDEQAAAAAATQHDEAVGSDAAASIVDTGVGRDTDWPVAAPMGSGDVLPDDEDRSVMDASGWSSPAAEPPAADSEAPQTAVEPEPADLAQQEAEPWRPPAQSEEEFAQYSPIAGDEATAPSRWPRIFGLLLLIVAAAAAFWYFAPPEWKQRAGVAAAGATPLQLMITTSDRQPLASGNELVAISGRVINPTDQEQNVPPIRAELRDKQSKAIIHRWTIAPPTPSLAPRSSASFNSAEVDVPKGGDELTVTLGG